jgi:hypothetical protein
LLECFVLLNNDVAEPILEGGTIEQVEGLLTVFDSPSFEAAKGIFNSRCGAVVDEAVYSLLDIDSWEF